MQTAILGGGCFWCMQAIFQRIKGVNEVKSGYTGGYVVNPKYQDVKKQLTGHIQVIRVTFDPKIITYAEILQIFMHVHDPTQVDGQGEDIGSQYLSAIFYNSPEQKNIAIETVRKAQEEIQKNQQNKDKKIVTLIRQLDVFYIAQDYHQNYWNQKGNSNPYCNIIPGKIAKMKKYFAQKTVQDQNNN